MNAEAFILKVSSETLLCAKNMRSYYDIMNAEAFILKVSSETLLCAENMRSYYDIMNAEAFILCAKEYAQILGALEWGIK